MGISALKLHASGSKYKAQIADTSKPTTDISSMFGTIKLSMI